MTERGHGKQRCKNINCNEACAMSIQLKITLCYFSVNHVLSPQLKVWLIGAIRFKVRVGRVTGVSRRFQSRSG